MAQILRRITIASAVVVCIAGAIVDVPLLTPTASADTCRGGTARCRSAPRRPPAHRRTPTSTRGSRTGAIARRDDRPGASRSRSVGRASRGRLLFGVPLADAPYLDVRRGSHFGTRELVDLIDHAARTVSAGFPGSRLSVGDLSREGGGHLRPHRSHRTGGDADIGFYFVDTDGHLAHPGRFVRVGADGSTEGALRFDDARNWALLRAMLEFQGANVQYVFVSPPIAERLLEEGRRTGASPALLDRAAEAMSHHARGHENHFHVRIHCPSDDATCEDREPPRRRGRGRQPAPRRAPARATIDV